MSATFGLYFKGMSQEEVNAMRQRLNTIAASHGYTSERGPTTGEGNAAEMLMAIDSGELATVLLADEERASVIAWLDQQAEQLRSTDALLADTVKTIANQLYAAVRRERDAEEQEMRNYEEA